MQACALSEAKASVGLARGGPPVLLREQRAVSKRDVCGLLAGHLPVPRIKEFQWTQSLPTGEQTRGPLNQSRDPLRPWPLCQIYTYPEALAVMDRVSTRDIL
ncbi:hypothetical protein SKAU_G00071680 [Synaphobranchus kaupii]|uniref:Uncharacterized protein n=1 Tax=Synaphobranchus kaupii TaxID=118154 RepID=A0A9Q1G7R7_SYNKA|nr:hypothetical protein SKAU_G00071680 [Synaphobranchus kaupii]